MELFIWKRANPFNWGDAHNPGLALSDICLKKEALAYDKISVEHFEYFTLKHLGQVRRMLLILKLDKTKLDFIKEN